MTTQRFGNPLAIAGDVGPLRARTVVELRSAPPQLEDADGSPTWLARAANFVVAISRVRAGTRLLRADQRDEYMIMAPPGVSLMVSAGPDSIVVEPDSLTMAPPGESVVTARNAGYVYRIFSSSARDLAEASSNASAYEDGAPEIAPLRPWPEPVGGFRLRTYPLSSVKAAPGAFGRIYRSTNLMVNLFQPFTAPRSTAALSPHQHDDFEQCSLTLAGTFEHYLRTPWGRSKHRWQPDETIECDSPSLLVIPARTIHTTAWTGSDGRLVDIFAPPRRDFSLQPGWVLNAADYPPLDAP